MEIKPSKNKYQTATNNDLVLVDKHTGEIIDLGERYELSTKDKAKTLNIQLKTAFSSTHSKVTYKNFYLLDKNFLKYLITSSTELSLLDLGLLLHICCFIDFKNNTLVDLNNKVKEFKVDQLARELDMSRHQLLKSLEKLEKMDVLKKEKIGQYRIVISPHFATKGKKQSIPTAHLALFEKEFSSRSKVAVSSELICSTFNASNYALLGLLSCLVVLSNNENVIKQRSKNSNINSLVKTLSKTQRTPLKKMKEYLNILLEKKLIAEDEEGVFISPAFVNSTPYLFNRLIDKFEPTSRNIASTRISPSIVSNEF